MTTRTTSPTLADEDLGRRLEARRASEHLRSHAFCVRCRQRIPKRRKWHARYCSDWCRRRHRFERLAEWRKELRRMVRALSVVERCACGEALDTRVRPGPVPAACRRCKSRELTRAYRARRKAEGRPC